MISLDPMPALKTTYVAITESHARANRQVAAGNFTRSYTGTVILYALLFALRLYFHQARLL